MTNKEIVTIFISRSNCRDNALELRNESGLKRKSTSINIMLMYRDLNLGKSGLTNEEEFNFSIFSQNQRMESGQLKHIFLMF